MSHFKLTVLLGLALCGFASAQPAKIVVKKDVVYGKVHGAALLADVAYPEGKGPFPVILSVHGGRWVASHRNDPGEGAINVEQWAGLGFFAMTIDYRLVACSPPPACYQDLQCAIRWVHANANTYPIDKERIFLIGMSAGGHLVSLAATLGEGAFARTGGWEKSSNDIRGVISLSGPYDLEELSWGNLWKPATGDQLEARRLASPIRHITAKSKPILILHSDNDGSVPIKQAQNMAEALAKAKAPHRFVQYEKKGHMRITEEVIKETRAFVDEVSKTKPEPPPAKRGTAKPNETRPAHFPHCIWAACDFEAPTPDYAWFGPTESKNISVYPGNATALGVKEKPYGNFAGLMTGINPVPGPMMGKSNKMYCRYFLKGGTDATFQHFSLSVEDNNHIRVSGLTEGKWSEVTLNFTRDAARNNGSEKAFQKGERMDDLKVFVGKPKDGKDYELFLDDVLFFDDDPDMPKEKEPFPNRVIFLAAFDTGIDAKSKPKYWPGEFEIVTKIKGAPDDSYWGVAQAVPQKATKGKWIRLEIKPPRPVGSHTKLRFRYHLSGTTDMTVQVFDATDGDNRHLQLKGLKEATWQWAILDFTNDAKRNDGKNTPFAAGHKADDLFFFVKPSGDKDVQLYIDEVTLFDAGTAR